MTTTISAPKLVNVTIQYTHDVSISMTSPRTGSTITLDLTQLGVNWSRQENALFDRLMTGASPRTVSLTVEETRIFHEAWKRTNPAQTAPATPSKSENVTSALVKPAIVDEPIISSVPLARPTSSAPASITQTSHTVVNRLTGPTSKSAALLEYNHRKAEQLRDSLEKDYIVLWYMIPVTLNSDCPNPSGLLRKLGFVHMDGSNWLGTTDMLNSPRVKELFAHWDAYRCDGLEYHTFDISERQRGQFRAIIERYIDRLVYEAHASLINTIASADKQLEEALAELNADPTAGEKQRSEKESYRHNRVRTAIRSAGEALSVAVRAAEKYDDLQDTKELFLALRTAINARAGVFNALAQAKGIKPAPKA